MAAFHMNYGSKRDALKEIKPYAAAYTLDYNQSRNLYYSLGHISFPRFIFFNTLADLRAVLSLSVWEIHGSVWEIHRDILTIHLFIPPFYRVIHIELYFLK